MNPIPLNLLTPVRPYSIPNIRDPRYSRMTQPDKHSSSEIRNSGEREHGLYSRKYYESYLSTKRRSSTHSSSSPTRDGSSQHHQPVTMGSRQRAIAILKNSQPPPSRSSERSSSSSPQSSKSSDNLVEFPHLPLVRVQRNLVGSRPIVSEHRENDFHSMSVEFKIPAAFVDSIKSGTHDIQLRVFQENWNALPTISYPSHFEIYLNNKKIGVNGMIGGFPAQRVVLNAPLMLGTALLADGANSRRRGGNHISNKFHKITCRWKKYAVQDHKLCISLVRVRNVQELVDEVLNKPHLPVEHTRKMILNAVGDDGDVKMDNYKASLNCPCDTRRILTPARSFNCDHLRFFDLTNFINLNKTRPIWKCPVCNGETAFSSIVIDSYFTEVLGKMKLNPINEIEFLKDGTWRPHAPKNDDNTVLVGDSDDEDMATIVTFNNSSTNSSVSGDQQRKQSKESNPFLSLDPRLRNNRSKDIARCTNLIQAPPKTTTNPVPEVITLGDSSDDDEPQLDEETDDIIFLSSSSSPPQQSSSASEKSIQPSDSAAISHNVDGKPTFECPTIEQYEEIISSIINEPAVRNIPSLVEARPSSSWSSFKINSPRCPVEESEIVEVPINEEESQTVKDPIEVIPEISIEVSEIRCANMPVSPEIVVPEAVRAEVSGSFKSSKTAMDEQVILSRTPEANLTEPPTCERPIYLRIMKTIPVGRVTRSKAMLLKANSSDISVPEQTSSIRCSNRTTAERTRSSNTSISEAPKKSGPEDNVAETTEQATSSAEVFEPPSTKPSPRKTRSKTSKPDIASTATQPSTKPHPKGRSGKKEAFKQPPPVKSPVLNLSSDNITKRGAKRRKPPSPTKSHELTNRSTATNEEEEEVPVKRRGTRTAAQQPPNAPPVTRASSKRTRK